MRAAPTNAQELYEQSMEDLDGGLYPEALKGFADLKSQYPYTKFAALADLRTADTQFKRGKHLEAVDAYRTFLKLHPNHEEAPYAMFQIGEAYYEQIPDDWFFLPPAAEKDQGNTRLAITGYQDTLARYPDAEIAKQAKARQIECRTKLAEHEMYVASFYFKRAVYVASARRAEGLLATYSDLGFDEEALWMAGFSRHETGEFDKAREHFTKLQKSFPQGSWAEDASELLRRMPSAPAAAVDSPSPTPDVAPPPEPINADAPGAEG